jgi:hypothetical protein
LRNDICATATPKLARVRFSLRPKDFALQYLAESLEVNFMIRTLEDHNMGDSSYLYFIQEV